MLNKPSLIQQTRFWLIVLPLAITALWIYAFFHEINLIYLWLVDPQFLLALGVSEAELRKSIVIMALNMVSFPVYLLLATWAVSQFVLPVKLPSERVKVFKRLILFLFGGHGPAVFIKEGKIQGDVAELKSSRPGVAFVDLTSAVVLERQPIASSSSGGVTAWERHRRSRLGRGTAHTPATVRSNMVRAEGPGVVFTEAGERIRGMVSLRRQFAIRPNVHSITKDGFEVFAHMITIFTLGDPPDVLRVGYLGDRAEDLRVLQLDERQGILYSVKDELNGEDKLEIHRLYQRAARFNEEFGATPGDDSITTPNAPYTFDAERVFKAVYAEARKPGEDEVISWLDLPGMVAVEIFHNLVSLYGYADLYQPKDPKRFPFVEEFRPEFSRRVRNQGVLSYQLVVRNDGRPLRLGEIYLPEDLTVMPARTLTNSKILRDRGIKVITATLPELRPVNPAVRQQLLDYWRSHWQRDRDVSLAAYDYQEMRVRATARAQAQNSIVKALTEIVQDESVSREAVTLRLLQAVESYAREPLTEKMVPPAAVNTLEFLINKIGNEVPGSLLLGSEKGTTNV
jgi:hypothetical protein